MTTRQGFQPAPRVEADEEEGVVDVDASFHDVDAPPPLDKRAHRKTATVCHNTAGGYKVAHDRLIQVKTKQWDAKSASISVDTSRLDALEDHVTLLDTAFPCKRNKNRPTFKERVGALRTIYGGKIPRGILQEAYNDSFRTEYHTHPVHEPLGSFY